MTDSYPAPLTEGQRLWRDLMHEADAKLSADDE